MAAVLRGHVAQDLGDRADAMEMLGPRRVDRGVVLEQHADGLVGARGSLRAGNGLRAAEAERRHDAGEQHGVAGRQDDQCAIGSFRSEAAACWAAFVVCVVSFMGLSLLNQA